MAQEEALDTELTATRFNHKEFQLQRRNHFEVQFNSGTGLDSDFKFMVVSFPLPKETTESSDINYFNTTVKVAGKTTFDNLQTLCHRCNSLKSDTVEYGAINRNKYTATNDNCPLCGAQLKIKYGRNGKFYACPNFPKCKFTKRIEK